MSGRPLNLTFPFAEQAVGRPDITGRGHEANLRLLGTDGRRGNESFH